MIQKIKSKKQRNKFSFSTPFFKREEGNYIDLMAGVFMMVCLFALILVMMAQAAMVEKRLDIKTAIKNTLYIAEQQGGLQQADVTALETMLGSYGCTLNDVRINNSTLCLDTGGKQVPYGDKITLRVSVTFTNPVYQVIGTNNPNSENNGWFKVAGISPTIDYTTEISSTSRW